MKRIVPIVLVIIIIILLFWKGFGTCSPIPPPGNCDTTITSWKHFIPKDTAQLYIIRLANLKTDSGFISNNKVAESHLFDSAKSMMRNMMLRDSCEGMRIYYGLNRSNQVIPMVCGVTSTGSDIYWRRLKPGISDRNARTGPVYEDGLCDNSQIEPPPPLADEVVRLGPPR